MQNHNHRRSSININEYRLDELFEHSLYNSVLNMIEEDIQLDYASARRTLRFGANNLNENLKDFIKEENFRNGEMILVFPNPDHSDYKESMKYITSSRAMRRFDLLFKSRDKQNFYLAMKNVYIKLLNDLPVYISRKDRKKTRKLKQKLRTKEVKGKYGDGDTIFEKRRQSESIMISEDQASEYYGSPKHHPARILTSMIQDHKIEDDDDSNDDDDNEAKDLKSKKKRIKLKLVGGGFLSNEEEGNWIVDKKQVRDYLTLVRNMTILKLTSESGFQIRNFLSKCGRYIYTVLYVNEENLRREAIISGVPKEAYLSCIDILSLEPVDSQLRPLRVNFMLREQFKPKNQEFIYIRTRINQYLERINLKKLRRELNCSLPEDDEKIENECIVDISLWKAYQEYLLYLSNDIEELRKILFSPNFTAEEIAYAKSAIQGNRKNYGVNTKLIKKKRTEEYYIGVYNAFKEAIKVVNERYGKKIIKTIWDKIGSDFFEPYMTFDKPNFRMKSFKLRMLNDIQWKKFAISENHSISLFSNLERTKITLSILSKTINLNYFLKKKYILSAFQTHDYYSLIGGNKFRYYEPIIKRIYDGDKDEDLNEKNYYEKCKNEKCTISNISYNSNLLGNWSFSLKKFWSVPTDDIREYFGEKIAYYFDFMSHICKYVAPLGFASLGLSIYNNWALSQPGSNLLILLNSLFIFAIVLWIQILVITWQNRESILASKYGLTNIDEVDAKRPTFKGKRFRSFENDKLINDMKFSQFKKFLKISLGYFCSLIFLVAVFFISYEIQKWDKQHQEDIFVSNQSNSNVISFLDINAYLIAALNFFILKITSSIYKRFNKMFTTYENHKTIKQYENSFCLKMFIFTVFNNLSPFFVGGFVFPFFNECPIYSCFLHIRRYAITYNTLTLFGNFYEVLKPLTIRKFENLKLKYQRKKKSQKNYEKTQIYLDEQPIIDEKERINDFIEKEFHKPVYSETIDISGTIFEYMEVFEAIAFLALFGGTYPLAFFLTMISWNFEIITDKMSLIKDYRRPLPEAEKKLGIWTEFLVFISFFSILVNVGIVVLAAGLFDNFKIFWFVFLTNAGFVFIFLFRTSIQGKTKGFLISERHGIKINEQSFKFQKSKMKISNCYPMYKIWGTKLNIKEEEHSEDDQEDLVDEKTYQNDKMIELLENEKLKAPFVQEFRWRNRVNPLVVIRQSSFSRQKRLRLVEKTNVELIGKEYTKEFSKSLYNQFTIDSISELSVAITSSLNRKEKKSELRSYLGVFESGFPIFFPSFANKGALPIDASDLLSDQYSSDIRSIIGQPEDYFFSYGEIEILKSLPMNKINSEIEILNFIDTINNAHIFRCCYPGEFGSQINSTIFFCDPISPYSKEFDINEKAMIPYFKKLEGKENFPLKFTKATIIVYPEIFIPLASLIKKRSILSANYTSKEAFYVFYQVTMEFQAKNVGSLNFFDIMLIPQYKGYFIHKWKEYARDEEDIFKFSKQKIILKLLFLQIFSIEDPLKELPHDDYLVFEEAFKTNNFEDFKARLRATAMEDPNDNILVSFNQQLSHRDQRYVGYCLLKNYEKAIQCYENFNENSESEAQIQKKIVNTAYANIKLMKFEEAESSIKELRNYSFSKKLPLHLKYCKNYLALIKELFIRNDKDQAMKNISRLWSCLKGELFSDQSIQGQFFTIQAKVMMEFGEPQKALMSVEKGLKIDSEFNGELQLIKDRFHEISKINRVCNNFSSESISKDFDFLIFLIENSNQPFDFNDQIQEIYDLLDFEGINIPVIILNSAKLIQASIFGNNLQASSLAKRLFRVFCEPWPNNNVLESKAFSIIKSKMIPWIIYLISSGDQKALGEYSEDLNRLLEGFNESIPNIILSKKEQECKIYLTAAKLNKFLQRFSDAKKFIESANKSFSARSLSKVEIKKLYKLRSWLYIIEKDKNKMLQLFENKIDFQDNNELIYLCLMFISCSEFEQAFSILNFVLHQENLSQNEKNDTNLILAHISFLNGEFDDALNHLNNIEFDDEMRKVKLNFFISQILISIKEHLKAWNLLNNMANETFKRIPIFSEYIDGKRSFKENEIKQYRFEIEKIAFIFNNLAIMQKEKEEFIDSKHYFETSESLMNILLNSNFLSIDEKSKNNLNKLFILSNIFEIELILNNFEEAEIIYNDKIEPIITKLTNKIVGALKERISLMRHYYENNYEEVANTALKFLNNLLFQNGCENIEFLIHLKYLQVEDSYLLSIIVEETKNSYQKYFNSSDECLLSILIFAMNSYLRIFDVCREPESTKKLINVSHSLLKYVEKHPKDIEKAEIYKLIGIMNYKMKIYNKAEIFLEKSLENFKSAFGNGATIYKAEIFFYMGQVNFYFNNMLQDYINQLTIIQDIPLAHEKTLKSLIIDENNEILEIFEIHTQTGFHSFLKAKLDILFRNNQYETNEKFLILSGKRKLEAENYFLKAMHIVKNLLGYKSEMYSRMEEFVIRYKHEN